MAESNFNELVLNHKQSNIKPVDNHGSVSVSVPTFTEKGKPTNSFEDDYAQNHKVRIKIEPDDAHDNMSSRDPTQTIKNEPTDFSVNLNHTDDGMSSRCSTFAVKEIVSNQDQKVEIKIEPVTHDDMIVKDPIFTVKDKPAHSFENDQPQDQKVRVKIEPADTNDDMILKDPNLKDKSANQLQNDQPQDQKIRATIESVDNHDSLRGSMNTVKNEPTDSCNSALEPEITIKIEPADVDDDALDEANDGICDNALTEPEDTINMEIQLHPTQIIPCETFSSLPTHSRETDSESKQQDPAHRTATYETKRRKPHKCSMCDKTFPWKSRLVTHLKIHTGENLHRCNVCPKSFIKKSAYLKHLNVHSGEKPHQCSICSKRFLRKSDMNYHVRTHTGENLHHCSVCNKSFSSKTYLIMHLRIHTGDQLQCPVCSKNFLSASLLKRHMRIHTGERPYRCDLCQKGFVMKSHLNDHMNTHTGERRYQCAVCERGFSQKSKLAMHEKIHTGGLQECFVLGK